MWVRSGYNGVVAVQVYIPFIYIYLGRTLPYPVHGTTSYKSGLVLLGDTKFYYISTNSDIAGRMTSASKLE